MKKQYLLLFIVLMITAAAEAQINPISLGTWRMHIPYNKGIQVDESSDGVVYCAAKLGLFSYNKNNNEFAYYSTLNGLSDHEINNIHYDNDTHILLITYVNSNIDLLLPDHTVINLPDIHDKNIVGGKNINAITFINGSAYLSCEFGIVIVDLIRKEISETYYIGPGGTSLNVTGIAFDGATLFATTTQGVFEGDYYDPEIFSYTAWHIDNTLSQPSANYTCAVFFNNNIIVVKSDAVLQKDSLLIFDNGVWSSYVSLDAPGVNIEVKNNYLIYRNYYSLRIYDGSRNRIAGVEDASYPDQYIQRGYYDSDGTIWIADLNYGLVKFLPDQTYQPFTPDGPNSEAVYAMEDRQSHLWVASGSVLGDAPNYELRNGIYNFNGSEWKSYTVVNDTIYKKLSAASPSVVAVAVDPNDPEHAFIGSWGGGLVEYRQSGGVALYNQTNSALGSVNNLPAYILTGGLAFDPDGNLWAVTGYTLNAVSVKKAGGGWQSFSLPNLNFTNYVNYGLVIDDYGQKWFITHQGSSIGQGVSVFKENNLNSSANIGYKKLSDAQGDGALPDLFVSSIAKDKDGAIWLGTAKGVAVIYNPGNVFSGDNFDAQKIILVQDGYAQYLLETETVTAIAIDGANRKWFGTYSGGVFLMSSDGTKQLLNFNIDNSPLPSNNITAIAIDDKTGEVFIGTDKGIISYLGDATEGGDECTDHYVFPNPVRHDYHGPIAVRGLVANADVKITDVAGNLVFHTKANGGEVSWDGNNFKGERAQTGIYLVYVSNEDGTQTCVTKMLLAN